MGKNEKGEWSIIVGGAIIFVAIALGLNYSAKSEAKANKDND